MRARWYVMLWCGLLGPVSALAQDVTGNIEGWVADTGGTPVAGAEVVIRGTGLPRARATVSNARGYYRLDRVPVGSYQAVIRMIGYRPVVLTEVVVGLGRTTSAAVTRLDPRPIVLEDITVAATGQPLLDVGTAAGGANLSTEQFGPLPIERSYRNIPAILPSANMEREGVNISGGTGQDNLWFVDGANVTNPYNGASSTVIPWDFVQEVEVRTGGYEAEYRGALGGIVNVVTRSGGDEFHAQTFSYFLNNSITGNPRIVAGETPGGDFTHYDLGGSVSGPLVRGRAWFFAAYAPSFERQTVSVAGLRDYTDRSTRHSFAGKVTWQPGTHTTLVTSLLGDPLTRSAIGELPAVHDPSPTAFANPDPWLGRLRSGGVSGSLNATHQVSPTVLLASAFSVTRQHDDNRPATARGAAEPLFIDSARTWSGGYPDDVWSVHTTTTGRASALWTTGAHQVKGGAEFNQLTFRGDFRFDVYKLYTDGTWEHVQLDNLARVKNRTLSLFLQDSWLVTSRLRVNGGLRWDGERAYGSDGGLSLSIMDEFQPRLGLVLEMGAPGTAKLFGTYGRFYENLFTSLGSTYFAYGSNGQFAGYPQDPRVDTTGGSCYCFAISRIPNPKVKGQSYDEYSLGYERLLTPRMKVTARGVYRHLRWGLEDSWVDPATFSYGAMFGNPGRGVLSFMPRMRRDYTALELSVMGDVSSRVWLLGSYVLSRSSGNYPGLYDSDGGYTNSNTTGAFDLPEILTHSTGSLPNDRPHVFKLNGSFRLRRNLQLGVSGLIQSGRPLSELGTLFGPYHPFLSKRGAAGRAPTAWDLAARAGWTAMAGRFADATVLLDIYHIGSPRRALDYDQVHYLDDARTLVNPSYREPTLFQPPMAARVGMLLNF